MPPTPRPTWQIDECPSWCQQEHSENDHDRKHQSQATTLPIIALFLHLDQNEELVQVPEAIDMEVAASRRDGETKTWVYLGEGHRQHIQVSLESAQRIGEELAALLREVS